MTIAFETFYKSFGVTSFGVTGFGVTGFGVTGLVFTDALTGYLARRLKTRLM